MELLICDYCEKEVEVEDYDHIPRGWFLLFIFDNDDGNNYPSLDACDIDCLSSLATKAEEELLA